MSLTKDVDIDQYKYSGYGIGFDKKKEKAIGFGGNSIIFGVESSSVHVNNKKNNILKGPTQGLNGTTFAGKFYPINFCK